MTSVGKVQSQVPVESVKTDSAKVNQANNQPEQVAPIALTQDQITKNVKKGLIPGVQVELHDVLKKPVAISLIGVGGVGAVTAIAKAANSEVGLRSLMTIGPKPHMASTVNAGLIGAGIGILSLDSHGDKKTEDLTRNVGGAVLGTGIGGLVSTIARTAYTFDDDLRITSASPATMAYGGAIGLGIALANTDLKDKDANLLKNAVSGGLIGTGVGGIGGAFIRTLAAESLRYSTVSVIALGAAAGVGLGIALSE